MAPELEQGTRLSLSRSALVPRYFFNVRSDVNVVDEEGIELPDELAARNHAVSDVVELAGANVLEHRKLDLSHLIDVADESGRVLFTVRFGDVLTVIP
jgi:hypothetical protein